MDTTNVVLVDLREAPGDLPSRLAGGVLVLDHADSLVKHAEIYLSLMGEALVTAVVCVAIGESGTTNPLDGHVLTVPAVLREATVLWVGDPHGVEWAMDAATPRLPVNRTAAFDELVAALQVPTVFDRVVTMTEDLGSPAVNPGVRVASIATDLAGLAEARAAAVRSLSATDQAPNQNLSTRIRQLDATHDAHGTVLTGPVGAAGHEAGRRLSTVAGLAGTLGTWRALVGDHRPTEHLGDEVAQAGRSVEAYRLGLLELLSRMDGHLLRGDDPPIEKVVELGVHDPREARVGEIAAGLRLVVETRLDEHASLTTLAHELRYASATSGPQGCSLALAEVGRTGPLALPMPAMRRWPISLAMLPLVVLTCALSVLLAGRGWPGWLAGGVLAACWFSSGWLLLARRPGSLREVGFTTSFPRAILGYGLSAALGMAGGVTATGPVLDAVDISWLTSQIALVGVALLWPVVTWLSWRSAVRRWRTALPVDNLIATLAGLTRLAEEVTVREWLPMRRRRAIAAAAAEVAGALEEITRTLRDSGNRLFVAPGASSNQLSAPPHGRSAPKEVYDVVREDLSDLCRRALDPAWPAAEAGRRSTPGLYAGVLDRLLGEYGAVIRRHGLTGAPGRGGENGPRGALLSRLWSETPALAGVLAPGASRPMTQLCRGGQLPYLSTAGAATLLRFAPVRLRRVLERDGAEQGLATDPDMTWSEGAELVGALRLVPLRPESVHRVIGGAPQ